MSNSALSEIYFIAAMFILILIVCGVAMYFFFRTYNREKQAQAEAKKSKMISNAKSEVNN